VIRRLLIAAAVGVVVGAVVRRKVGPVWFPVPPPG
jgi:hypothetical protein